MKTKINHLILFVLILIVATNLKAQTIEWVNQIGSNGSDHAGSITTDENGNIYVTGYFRETVDFDPGPATLNLTSNGDADIFIQKLDPDGNLNWVKQMVGTDAGYPKQIITDEIGNVYTIGNFFGTVDFDPGIGVMNLTSIGVSNDIANVFVQKLDTNGDLIWVKQFGGIIFNEGQSITIDTAENVYTTGHFEGTVDFDPGVGITNFTSFGDTDIFVQKLDVNGDFLWAKQIGGANLDYGTSITIDNNIDNIYTVGYFEGTVDFEPGTNPTYLTSNGNADIFIQKLNTNGELIWLKQIGGLDYDYCHMIVNDGNGNICLTGNFGNTVDFDPNTGTTNLSSNGYQDVFIQKLDDDGNLLWVKQIGGIGYEFGGSIATDLVGSVYSTGSFRKTVDFDPGKETTNIPSIGSRDVFIQKLDSNGNFNWAMQVGGANNDIGISLVTDVEGNVYHTGNFQEEASFNPGSGSENLTSEGSFDIFVQKIKAIDVGIIENNFQEKIQVYPNPTKGNFSIEFENNQQFLFIRLWSFSGQLIETASFEHSNIIQMKLYQPRGIYIVEIQDGEGHKASVCLVKE